MKINKNSIMKFLGVFNSLALLFVAQSANSTCAFFYHQPEFPAAANRFRKLQ